MFWLRASFCKCKKKQHIKGPTSPSRGAKMSPEGPKWSPKDDFQTVWGLGLHLFALREHTRSSKAREEIRLILGVIFEVCFFFESMWRQETMCRMSRYNQNGDLVLNWCTSSADSVLLKVRGTFGDQHRLNIYLITMHEMKTYVFLPLLDLIFFTRLPKVPQSMVWTSPNAFAHYSKKHRF